MAALQAQVNVAPKHSNNPLPNLHALPEGEEPEEEAAEVAHHKTKRRAEEEDAVEGKDPSVAKHEAARKYYEDNPDAASSLSPLSSAAGAHAEPAANNEGAHAEHEANLGKEGLDEHSMAHYVIVPVGLAVVVSLFLDGCLEKFHISWLPGSAATLGVGVLLGIYMKGHIGNHAVFKHEDVFSETAATLLTLFLLPMLIFEPGWSMRVRDFASQFQYILLYAIVGSLISFSVVGMCILWTGEYGLHSITAPRTAFAFASLIAATDPVATLGTYAKLKVDPLLNTLVMGDSIFNDAVAIVLFKVLNSDEIMGTPDSRPTFAQLSGSIFGGIGKIFMGSLGMGFGVAALFLVALRIFNLREEPRLEILAIIAMTYINFAVAEVMGMSGIISTIFFGILLGIYARPHLTPEGSLLADFYIKQTSNLMDILVFLLTGFSVVMLDTRGFIFGGWVMLFCLLSRATAVFPVSFIANLMKRGNGYARGVPEEDWHLVTPKTMFMIWHAGLRGAIALTLCMQLGPWVDILDGPGTRHILQTATYFLICIFLIVFGGSTEAFLKCLSIPMGHSEASDDTGKLYRSEVPGSLQSFLSTLDAKFFSPLFIGDADLAASMNEDDKHTEVEEVLKRALSKK